MSAARQAGHVSVELALGVGVLLFPVLMLVALLPTWVERQSMARLAAQEAAREVVLADSWGEGTSEGAAMALQVATNHGTSTGDLDVSFEGALERGATVMARVVVEMPALEIPLLGGVGSWRWTASHAERVDDYRSFTR